MTNSISRISIQKICNYCDINRSTFYYHFIDRDDLIRWIFEDDIVRHYLVATPEQWINNTVRLLKMFKDEYGFYSQAMTVDSVNDLRFFIYDTTRIKSYEYIDSYLNGRKISSSDREFIVDFYSSAFADTHINYLRRGAKEEPEEFAHKYFKIIEPGLKEAIEQFTIE
jgi:AcrR family transcriptional regulator